MDKPFMRSPYNYDMSAISESTGLVCNDVSLAVQSERDETDINTIVRRFGLTGQLPSDLRAPEYGDFTGVSDFQSALQAVSDAEASFMKLPGDVRARFENDPQQFLEFCSEERNRDEMKKYGLLVPDRVDPVLDRLDKLVQASVDSAKHT